MPAYTPTTWVNDVTPTNATNLNKIETQLAAVQYGTNIVTPYQLANNATINSGNTNTYTCTGGSTGVPTGAKAVFCNAYYTASAGGTFASFTPQGTAWSNGNYPIIAAPTAALYSGSFLAALNASNGQLDVKANSGNLVGIYLWLYAYIY